MSHRHLFPLLFCIFCAQLSPAELCAKEKPTPLVRADVNEVVERWLNAQNKGDFQAYADCYADRFFGIKRSGSRTYKFDRKGWLKDRKRMFKRKVTVQAANSKIRITTTQAVVHFEQTWASGRYKDVGPKQLVIVKTKGAAKIAREEMLSSSISGGTAKAILDGFGFVEVAGSSGNWGIILSQKVPDEWTRGKVRSITRGQSAARTVAEKKLPAKFRRLKGKRYKLYGPNGELCDGKIQGFAALGRAEPHFGSVQEWNGENDGRKRKDAEVAADIWSMTEDRGRGLVGVFDQKFKKCRKASWAIPSGSPAPVQYVPVKLTRVLTKKLLRRFRGLAGHKKIQSEFADETGKRSPWDQFDGIKPIIRVFQDPRSKSQVAAVSADTGPGCGQFSGSFWAVWNVSGATIKLLTDAKNPGDFFRPESVVDIDADGTPELLDWNTMLRFVEGKLKTGQETEAPNFDCPC
jgi:ketosteroid isomerase-like protein